MEQFRKVDTGDQTLWLFVLLPSLEIKQLSRP